MRLNLEIDRQGVFFFLLNALIGAYNRRTDTLAAASKDLSESIVVLAQAVAGDNPELQAKINGLAETLKAETSKVKEAVDNA